VFSSVDRCIETYGLLVFLVAVLVVFVVVKLFVLVAAGTIIHLVDCLYDVFMESEESFSTAKATAISEAATAEATTKEESFSTAISTVPLLGL